MFQLWGKLMKNHKFLDDVVIENTDPNMQAGEMIVQALNDICYKFDLQRPMWFDKNTKEMARFRKTSFHSDQFIEDIWFDYLEIEILEMDTIG